MSVRIRYTLILMTLLAALAPVVGHAAPSPACAKLGMDESKCSDPDLGPWGGWQAFVIDTPGAQHATEAAAVGEALTRLSASLSCALSHTMVDVPWVSLDQVWNWSRREGATRIRFAGFPPNADGKCNDSMAEVQGSVSIQRSRTVRCPKGYTWQVRNDDPAVCVRD